LNITSSVDGVNELIFASRRWRAERVMWAQWRRLSIVALVIENEKLEVKTAQR